jgi:dTDP-4-amino-4,6-dideoxygalactose transaminase
MTHEPDGPWYYQQVALGLNYRMTDIQAALGLSQMRHLDEWVAKRHAIAARYDRALAKLPFTRPVNAADSYSAWHLYPVLVDDGAPIRRKELLENLRSDGIGANVHYIPVPSQPYYRDLGSRPEDFPISESYYRRAISLPIFASLTEAQQDYVVERLHAYCRPA